MAIYIGVNAQGNYLRAEAFDVEIRDGVVEFTKSLGWTEDTRNLGAKGDREQYASNLEILISDLMVRVNISTCDGIAIAQSGVISKNNDILLYSNALDLVNVPLKKLLQSSFQNIPIWLFNGVFCQATTEMTYGNGKDINSKNYIYVSSSGGISCAIFVNGDFYEGSQGIAGEIGHISIADKPRCTCGSYGCAEIFAGLKGIIENIRARVRRSPEKGSIILRELEKAEKSSKTLSLDTIKFASKRGDTIAIESLNDAAGIVGLVVKNVINTLNPDTVLLGGDLFVDSQEPFVGIYEDESGKHEQHYPSLFSVASDTIRSNVTFGMVDGLSILPASIPTVDAKIKGSILNLLKKNLEI